MSAPTRKPRAVCPACTRELVVTADDRFPRHRRPEGGMCAVTSRVRKAHRVHDCRRCRALPVQPGAEGEAVTLTEVLDVVQRRREFRPPEPRPLKARGYCASHLREVDAEQRQRARDKYRADTYGITPEQHAELVDAQGGGCACGFTHSASVDPRTGRALGLATDHDHDREAQCVAAGRHPAGKACEHCVRGALGRRCNTEIVGRFTSAQLRNLADYMDTPTAQRLGWWDDPTPTEET